ncbi:hypothetical protein O0L34_g5090 [Tuta absoluta]|nr:hypothetical protein O0L34_g5090 [Tuta absoluta]
MVADAQDDVLAETDWEAAMVADAVHGAHARPSAVSATLCWPPNKKVKLHSAFTKRDQVVMVRFSKPGSIQKLVHDQEKIVFLVDLSCANISEHLKLSNKQKLFRSPSRWILLAGADNSSLNGHRIPKEDIDVLPDGEVIVVKTLEHGRYDLYFIYKIGGGAKWRTEQYGTWTIQNKLRKTEKFEEVTALRRTNLHKYEIAAAVVITNNSSVNHLLDGKEDHIDTVSKANFPPIDHLMDYINATKKYIFMPSWGYKYNDTWTGISGLLVRDEVEIGVSPLFITKDRWQELSFIIRPTPTDMKFVFIQPKLSYTQNLYLLSFSPAVWRCLTVLVLLMLLALFAVARWEWKKFKDEEKELKPRTLRGNISDVAVVVLGAICQQGSPVELKGSLGRVVMLLLFAFLMFIYTSYSANIVALLQSSSSHIRTVEDLLHSRISLGVDDNPYNRFFFSTVTKPVHVELYRTKIAPPGSKERFFSLEDGVRKIQKGLFAFHMEPGVGYKFVNKLFREGEKCGLQEIDFFQLPTPWTATRKYTPYFELYKIGTKHIKEAGMHNRNNVRMYDKRPICSGRESNFVSVTMVDCYPALLELTYGMLLAIFVFFIEILLNKRAQITSRICGNLN